MSLLHIYSFIGLWLDSKYKNWIFMHCYDVINGKNLKDELLLNILFIQSRIQSRKRPRPWVRICTFIIIDDRNFKHEVKCRNVQDNDWINISKVSFFLDSVTAGFPDLKWCSALRLVLSLPDLAYWDWFSNETNLVRFDWFCNWDGVLQLAVLVNLDCFCTGFDIV